MSKPKFQFTVLCEDMNHYLFISSYLKHKHSIGRVHLKISPAGKGSGEQYVRDHFAKEVKAHRSKSGQNAALIVVTDVDTYTFDRRWRSLTKNLDKPLSENDKIIILIPARNIETWFRYADNPEDCNETDDYKHGYKKVDPSQYGAKYAEENIF